jgi:hypothetical protein
MPLAVPLAAPLIHTYLMESQAFHQGNTRSVLRNDTRNQFHQRGQKAHAADTEATPFGVNRSIWLARTNSRTLCRPVALIRTYPNIKPREREGDELHEIS